MVIELDPSVVIADLLHAAAERADVAIDSLTAEHAALEVGGRTVADLVAAARKQAASP